MQDELRGEHISLRSVDKTDAEALLPAYNGDRQFNEQSGEPEVTLAAAQADMLEALAMPGGRVWRITRLADGALLGVASTALIPPPHNGWIALLVILEAEQHQGYGTEAADLLEAALFAEPGITRLGLGVQAQNEKALAFWEKRGFQRGLKRRDNQNHEVFTMRKDRPDLAPEAAEQAERTRAQFGKTAAAYGASTTHARGGDLEEIANLAATIPADGLALDVATGGGHTAFAIAPYILQGQVIASDLTQEMLDETARGAAARGLTNITTVLADVHALPFPNEHFDLVTSRIAPHHFAALSLAVREMVRVTKPGGLVVIVDNIVPEDPALDAFFNHVEQLRDPSHVRSRTETEWREIFADSGLLITQVERYAHTHDYAEWVARAQVSPQVQPLLEAEFLNASEAARASFHLQSAGGHMLSYTDEKILIAGRKDASVL